MRSRGTSRGLAKLSEPGIDETTLAIKYYGTTGTARTWASTKWKRDPTAPGNVVILASLPELSADYRNPLWAEYTSKLADLRGAPSVGRLKQAVRLVLTHEWACRGEVRDPHLRDKALLSILASCRLTPAV